MSKTEARKIDHHLVYAIGAQVMSAQIKNLDPAAIADAHLNLVADMAVRAALALDAAIPRAEERLAAEAKAAADAAAAQEAADKATKDAADEAAAQAAKDAKASVKK